MSVKKAERTVMDAQEINRALTRVAHEISERSHGVANVALVGIRSGGVHLANRLVARLKEIEGTPVPVGTLDITLYRDDLDQVGGQARVRATEINFDLSDYVIVLVDDVLFTGRTVRAALDALTDLGRPNAIKLAVLVDRGGRELPIQPDFVGMRLPRTDKHVQVRFGETDGEDKIIFKE